jgi:DNA-binding IclR family transcriptional regulator
LTEVQSLARGLKILDMLAFAEDSVSVTDVAQRLDIDKSSASRLLHTLALYGYADQDPDSRRYRLSPRLMTLSRQFIKRMPLREQAKPFLYDLVEVTGEAAHVAVYAQGQAMVIADVESNRTLRVAGGIGRLAPLYCTAIGKILLAFSGAPVPGELPRQTERTITSHQQLTYHLEEIRYRGYALDNEETDDGVRCLAVPVYDYSGDAIAALGISGPAMRLTVERVPELADAVKVCSRKLSERLGYQPHIAYRTRD